MQHAHFDAVADRLRWLRPIADRHLLDDLVKVRTYTRHLTGDLGDID